LQPAEIARASFVRAARFNPTDAELSAASGAAR
jgi:hypothetical protein